MSDTRLNMKISFVLALCTFLLLRTVESFPTSDSAQPWTKIPAQRRATSSDESNPTTGEISPQTSIPFTKIPLKVSYNPSNPFLSIKPFLPVKPTFLPPFIDPQIFIDRKTALLNNLFSPSSATSGVSPQPGFWIPANAAVTPNYFADKKSAFLNNLFNQLASQSTPPGTANAAKRSIAGAGITPVSPWAPVVDPKVFVDKKTEFLNKLFASLNASTDDADAESDVDPITVKPTIVPPNFWSPFGASQATVYKPAFPLSPIGKPSPVVDPSYFVDKKNKFLNTLFNNLGLPPKPVGVTPAKIPIVPTDFWAPPGKPTIAGIYDQKVSEFLDKLFNSLNTSTPSPKPCCMDKQKESADNDNEQDETSVERRSIGNPFIPPPFASTPVVDPTIFANKKSDFLSKLFANLYAPDQYDENYDDAVAPNVIKPTIVPPNFWSPFAPSQSNIASEDTVVPVGKPAPVVDPNFFIAKRTKFLNTLFNNLGLPVKPSKPSIVSPDFWIPPGKIATSTTYNQKVSDYLDKLFTLPETTSLQKRHNDDENDEDNGKVTNIIDELTDDSNEMISNPSRRDVVYPQGNSLQQESLLAAKDKVIGTIITELGGIKDNMLDTLAEIVQKQKEATAAAAQPAFPFGPPAGIGKKGGPPPGVGKKGGPPPGAMKKMGGPYGGSFPFWGPTPKPTPDPTEPLQKRLEMLNQVFDMLTKLQKDVTLAVNQAANDNLVANPPPPSMPDDADLTSIIERLMQQNNNSTTSKKSKKVGSSKPIRAIQSQTSPFQMSSSDPTDPNSIIQDETEARTRSIKMAVHQGYQSLPPGAEEFLQAGGGSGPENHEGGGIKLQIKVPA